MKTERKATKLKATVIMKVTEWDTKEKLRRARVNGYVKQIKDSKGIWYLYESINPIFLKKTA